MTVAQTELQEYCEQVTTTGMLYRIFTTEGNEAAELLQQDVKAKALNRHLQETNEEFAARTGRRL